jgi:ferredoxin
MSLGKFVFEAEDFQRLLDSLKEAGYQVVGPTIQEGAITYSEIDTVDALPINQTDEQEGGHYRLKERGDNALFGYTVGPDSWKKYLFPSSIQLWQAQRSNGSFEIAQSEPAEVPRYAFIGARACELHAIAIQDKVFLEGDIADPVYGSRREHVFIVAVNCGQAASTCFCASMGAGPKVDSGFDLALTEILEAERHFFVVEVGTEQGKAILDQIPHQEANSNELQAADQVSATATAQMGRDLNQDGLQELLYDNYNNPEWEKVAARCLSCGNCTMVCPTCFCSTVEDVTDLTGTQAERWRKWDSCFTMDYSYIHGGSVRYSPQARYRQWMTHKLATWIDQFGTSGCVGCGRCITWCPVGIDITQEVSMIREQSKQKG